MPLILLKIAAALGISPLRVIMYGVLALSVMGGALYARQHYIDIGWYKHAAKIEKQNNTVREVSKEVERKTAECQAGVNGYWDVITKSCQLDDEGENQ